MRILLDECAPLVIKKRLSKFAIFTVQEMGWSGTQNGALLKLAEAEFEVFITTDKNLKHQQNLSDRTLAFIQLPTNQVPVIIALLEEIEMALISIETGQAKGFLEIPLPSV